ncbi:MAG: preprotein translocase subunit SecY [SAR86 cluster bacterium]|nr:preprotein translocase subunit SecY [SAR86 cluster bacterium]
MSFSKQTESGKGLSELWARLRFVLLAIIIYRIGTHIPIPGIDPDRLASLFEQNQGTLIDMFNMFSGGALERMSIMALNIMPYITASIIMSLIEGTTPSVKKRFREEGGSGRNQRTQYVRYGTILLAIIQSSGLALGLQNQDLALEPGIIFQITAVVSLVTGTVFLMWLGEQVTEKGIGNGISIIIFSSIVAGLPRAIGQVFEQARQGDLSLIMLLVIGIVALAAIAFIVWIERGQRRITVNYARRQQGRKMVQGQASYLPMKINQAGVIPAIFASSLLLFPASASTWFGQSDGFEWLQEIALALGPGQPLYVITFASLIAFFCFFYTALQFDPKEMSENLRKSGAYMPGIRPGEQSANYIDSVMTKLTVWGSAYLILVCLLPQFLIVSASVPFYLGGTSLLIVVVVVMDFMAQVQSHLMSQQYESLLKKANLKGYGNNSMLGR